MDHCYVKGCSLPLYSSGLCSKHYNRLRTTGTTDDGPRARAPLSVRFWKHVKKGRPNQCWEWTAKSRVRGYGVIKLDDTPQKMLAHRVSWELANGKLPESDDHHGTVVRHKCNNRLCVNPRHLEIGSQADNVADMWATSKKRGNARLTEKQVEEIRKSPLSSRKIAPLYGVTDPYIRALRKGKSWSK